MDEVKLEFPSPINERVNVERFNARAADSWGPNVIEKNATVSCSRDWIPTLSSPKTHLSIDTQT